MKLVATVVGTGVFLTAVFASGDWADFNTPKAVLTGLAMVLGVVLAVVGLIWGRE